MKTCPVCAAKAFDDAEVCYGCLHRFEEGEARASIAEGSAERPSDVARDVVEKGVATPPEPAAIPFAPIVAAPGGWVMRVEFCCGAPLPAFEDDGCGAPEGTRRCPTPRFSMTEDGFMVHVDQGWGASEPLSVNRPSGRVRTAPARAVLRRRRASREEQIGAVVEELEE